MAWNIEIGIIPKGENLNLEDYIPGLFEDAQRKVGFEDAASCQMPPSICVSEIGDHIVVIDAGCRLTGFSGYLDSISRNVATVQFFRVSENPVWLCAKRDEAPILCIGIEQVMETGAIENPSEDGEEVAIVAMKKATGIEFPFEFWKDYAVFDI